MHSRKTLFKLSLILPIAALVVLSGVVFAAKPPPKNPTTADLYLAPTMPPCPELVEVTGIYQDGKGIYLPNESVEFGQNGDLRITPLCSAGRSINALLPAVALGQLTGPMESCRGVGALLKIPQLLNAQTGVVGQPALPPDYPKAASVYYYFFTDSNGDSKFSGRTDQAWNLVWQSGIHLTRREYADRTVYELTTELTSPNAELLRGAGSGGESKGTFCIPLRLTATRSK